MMETIPVVPEPHTRAANHRSRPTRRRAGLASSMLWLALTLGPPAATAAELEVVVTIKPVHALVSQVMSGIGEPVLLVTGSQSPHSFALRPSQAAALATADVVFRVSEQVEPFTRKALAGLPSTTAVVTLAEAPGVELLAQRRGDTFEAHEHGSEPGPAHDRHDDGSGHVGDGSRADGHVWLDPRNAKAMVEAIAAALVKARPEEAVTIGRNAAAARVRLDALEAAITAELAPVKDKPFAVLHDAYQYFERRFGLHAVAAITVSPDVPPSARRLSAIRARLGGLGAACVFSEPMTSAAVVAAVVEGTTARSGQLDPEGLTLAPGADAYDSLMRGLAKGMRDCLGG